MTVKKSKKVMSEEERNKILQKYNVCSTSVPNKINVEKVKVSDVKIDENLKSPVVSFMGHVDAGKTSLMDIIRGTKIQEGEAGGITQSIGSSFVPIEHIRKVTSNIKGKFSVEHNIPGVLIVDTPGHSAFSSMRDRGSSLCDIAILVIDINEGIKPQTEESIKLLKEKKVPFVIAATKIDMIYGWEESNEINLRKVLKKQSDVVNQVMMSCMEDLKYELSKFDLNAEFYFQNKNPSTTYSIVPISSKTKEGLSDLLSLIVYISQNWMSKKITYKSKLDATVMESHLDNKLGWVIDVILSNGSLNVGDKIAVTTNDGAKISTIRNIMVPTQIKNKVNWKSTNSIKASMGIRLIGSNLEGCTVGSSIFQINSNISENESLELAEKEYDKFWKSFDWDSKGVCMIAPTIGELDAAYNIMKENNIPVMRGEISKFNRKIAERYATSLENELNKENRLIIYFHSDKLTGKQEDEYKEICKGLGLNIIHDTVVYHLIEMYNELKKQFIEERKKELSEKGQAIFPCELQILKDNIYMNGGNDDLLFGVRVKAGRLLKGTPIISDKKVSLGKVISIQKNHKELNEAKIKEEVCIRVKNDSNISFGRHLNCKDKIISMINRSSIDELKSNFRDEMDVSDWKLVIEHMKLLGIKKN